MVKIASLSLEYPDISCEVFMISVWDGQHANTEKYKQSPNSSKFPCCLFSIGTCEKLRRFHSCSDQYLRLSIYPISLLLIPRHIKSYSAQSLTIYITPHIFHNTSQKMAFVLPFLAPLAEFVASTGAIDALGAALETGASYAP